MALIGISIDVVIATLLSFRIEYLIANFIGIFSFLFGSIKEKNAEIVVADADFEHDYSRIKDVFKLLEKKRFC